MTSRPSKKIERSLKKLGFSEDNKHHKYLRFTFEGKEITQTYLSHGGKDYGDHLLAMIAGQLYLSKKELLDLVDGKMTKEEYLRHLHIKGIL